MLARVAVARSSWPPAAVRPTAAVDRGTIKFMTLNLDFSIAKASECSAIAARRFQEGMRWRSTTPRKQSTPLDCRQQ